MCVAMPEAWLHASGNFSYPIYLSAKTSASHEKHSGTVEWANQQWSGKKKIDVY